MKDSAFNFLLFYQLFHELCASAITMAQPTNHSDLEISIGQRLESLGLVMLAYLLQQVSMMQGSKCGALTFHKELWIWYCKAKILPETQMLMRLCSAGAERWHITTSGAEAVPHCDIVLVTVPTPITEDLKPDCRM